MNEPDATGTMVELEAALYHADPALGSTDVRNLLRSPAHYRQAREGAWESEALRIGTLAHECILEPDRWSVRRTLPVVDKRTKAGRQALADFVEHAGAEGCHVVTAADRMLCEAMRDAVFEHRMARVLLEHTELYEQSCFWVEDGVSCKGRFDGFAPGLILDLKTTQDASPGAFRQAVPRYGYHTQAAHYRRGAHAATGELCDYVIVAVEKAAPFSVAVYTLDDEAISVGQIRRAFALRQYAKCRESGQWPGYPEAVQTLSLPYWATKE